MVKRFLFAVCIAFLLLPALAGAQQLATNFQSALSNTALSPRTCPANQSAGCALMYLQCTNTDAAIAYVQYWDQTAAPTVGTTAPKGSIGIPAATTTPGIFLGARLQNKLWVAATSAATGGSAPGAALVCNFGLQ